MTVRRKITGTVERAFSIVFTKPNFKNRTHWVVLQNQHPENPIAGVFSRQRKAYAYMNEFCAEYPQCTVEVWSVELNQKMFGYGASKYREVSSEEPPL